MAGFLLLRMSRAFDRRGPPDMKAKEHLPVRLGGVRKEKADQDSLTGLRLVRRVLIGL